MKRTIILAAAVCTLGAGCAARQPQARVSQYTRFYAKQPRSILVVPAVNETTEVGAPSVFTTTVPIPLAERGYYVFPVYVTDALLGDLGLTEPGLIHQVAPRRFNELFGADAVLFVTIRDWSTKWVGLASTVTVSMNYKLTDTRTGEVLWERNRAVVKQSGSGYAGGDLVGTLIAMAVDAALTALMTDYEPLAHQATREVLYISDVGLPAGHKHPAHGQDRESFF